MQVPFVGRAAASFPVDPGERAVGQPGDEVIAPRVIAVPPARLDALRTSERSEFAFFQLFRFKKPNWARAGSRIRSRIPFAGLDAPPGVLRAMIRQRGE